MLLNTPSIPNQIIKTGVFVDSPIDKIISIVENHNLKCNSTSWK